MIVPFTIVGGIAFAMLLSFLSSVQPPVKKDKLKFPPPPPAEPRKINCDHCGAPPSAGTECMYCRIKY